MGKKLKNLKWESVALEGLSSSVTDNLESFGGLEICTDYGLDVNNKKAKKSKPKKKRKHTSDDTEEAKAAAKKIKLSNGFLVEECNIETPSHTNNTNHITKTKSFHPIPALQAKEKNKTTEKKCSKSEAKEKSPKQKGKKLKLGEKEKEGLGEEALMAEDMLAWAEFKLPDEILKALTEMRFKQPTKIQQLSLPAAIHGRRDILGAAETGSGKTLAFGLPILTGIMKIKEKALLKGLDVYDIPYKKSSAKKKSPEENEEVTSKKDLVKNNKKHEENNGRSKKINKKKVQSNKTKESSEDGYSSGDSENGNCNSKMANLKNKVKQDSEEFLEEFDVPIKKRSDSSTDEGNDTDDDDEYVHLSEMLDSDDLAESNDEENDVDDFLVDGSDQEDDDNGDEDMENDEETDSQSEVGDNEGIGCVKVVDDIKLPGTVMMKTGKPLYALILTPTRELAIQISRHLIAVAKYTGIRVATIVGGMAAVKQERVLRCGPEIVVATPGRLWELVTQGEPHLQQLQRVKFLAIDETDRMVERGHFEELKPLLERLNADDEGRNARQNFVFSATLTMVHDLPSHMKGKKVTKRGKIINRKIDKMTPEQKIKRLVTMVGMTEPKVVDITTQNSGTAETLTECRIACSFDHKDAYLYYVLKRHPGRTIVFCNSIGCVKRLAQLFTLLKCCPLPLHASMPQRQRLKNLERFRDDPQGVLVATDVAARGLDIPDVDHVIHYQVPRTAENYVHRSGRTARANKEGLTILMMEPAEAFNYSKLCRTLNKTSELPTFPVSDSTLNPIRDIISLAREIDGLMLKKRKQTQEAGWREKVAKEMDMILDEDNAPSKPVDTFLDKPLKAKRRQLDVMLSRPVFPRGFSFKYPTLNEPGALQMQQENALQVMKKAIATGELKKQKRKSKNAEVLKLQKTFKNKNL